MAFIPGQMCQYMGINKKFSNNDMRNEVSADIVQVLAASDLRDIIPLVCDKSKTCELIENL